MQFDKESPPDLSYLGSSRFSINFPPFAILVISHPDEAATLPKASKGTISPPTHSFFCYFLSNQRLHTFHIWHRVLWCLWGTKVTHNPDVEMPSTFFCHDFFLEHFQFQSLIPIRGVACQRQNHPQAIYSAKLHHNQLAGKKEARMAKHRWRRNCVTSTLNSTLLVWRALLARLEHAPCSLLSFIQKRIFVPSLIWESRKGIRTLKRKVFLISWFQQLNSIPL